MISPVTVWTLRNCSATGMPPLAEKEPALPGPGVRNVRALELDEPLPPGATVLRFDRARLEVWRYGYELSAGELRAAQMASATQPGPAGSP